MAELVLNEGPAVAAAAIVPKLFSPRTLSNRPEMVEATRRVILRTSPEAIAAAQRGMAERPDVTGMLSEIDVETLVLCGREDAISSPAEMKQVAEAISGAEFIEIDRAGHMAPLENPDDVNSAILRFLRK
jgi:pimeloyl-ACP methyl ester carboxylesterase